MQYMNILGLKIDCLSFDDLFQIFDQWLSDKNSRSHSVALINVYDNVLALFDKKLGAIYRNADLRGIDGTPFLLWARLFYYKKSDRLYAPDMLEKASSKAAEKGYTFFLYGGFPGSVDKMEDYLCQRFEGVQVVGKYSPPFRPMTEEEDRDFCLWINSLSPDFIWVGLGTPKQDYWIHEHREKIKGSIMVASGATFDFFSGRIRQAPKWIRSSGFEWLFRLTHDFRRLWIRYTFYNIIFMFAFTLQLLHILRFKDVDQNISVVPE